VQVQVLQLQLEALAGHQVQGPTLLLLLLLLVLLLVLLVVLVLYRLMLQVSQQTPCACSALPP
jgi:hypothetical protein